MQEEHHMLNDPVSLDSLPCELVQGPIADMLTLLALSLFNKCCREIHGLVKPMLDSEFLRCKLNELNGEGISIKKRVRRINNYLRFYRNNHGLHSFYNSFYNSFNNRVDLVFEKYLLEYLNFCDFYLRLCREDPNKLNMYTLHCAAESGNLEMVKWLCDKKQLTPDYRTLALAVESGNVEMVKWLCDEKKIAPGNEILHIIARSGDLEMVQWLCENFGLTPTQVLFEGLSMEDNPMDVDPMDIDPVVMYKNPVCHEKHLVPNQTTLQCAAESGNLEMVQWLCEQYCLIPTREILDEVLETLSEDNPVVIWLQNQLQASNTTNTPK